MNEELLTCGSDAYANHDEPALVLIHLGLYNTLTPLCRGCLRDLVNYPINWAIVSPTERNANLING